MGLQLRVHELFAKDETDTGWTEWGSDDMYLGGVALEHRGSQAKPTVHKIDFFRVGTFDDGDRKRYNPPREFDNYGFGPRVFPKHIAATFVLVERDRGEMNKYLNELYERTKDEAEKQVVPFSTSLKEGEEGGGVNWAEVAEKAVEISIAVGRYVYGRWRGDEVFEPKLVTFLIDSEAHRWNGKTTSPIETIDFRGHNAHYILKYDWNMNFLASGT